MPGFYDNGTSVYKARRRPFISVYEGVAAAMVGSLVFNYSREQRQTHENKMRRAHGFRPVARINVIGSK